MIKRFAKFGVVGGLGFLINIAILYINKTYVFDKNMGEFYGLDISLNLSLASAIAVATTSNFILNACWTWGFLGKRSNLNVSKYISYIKIALIAIIVQIIATNMLVTVGLYYLIANAISIMLSSGVNFLLNDKLNFKS